MPLNDLLKVLEDSGEVSIQLAEHQLTKDSAGNFSVTPLDNVCFVLDPPKAKKKKAKVGDSVFCHCMSLCFQVHDVFHIFSMTIIVCLLLLVLVAVSLGVDVKLDLQNSYSCQAASALTFGAKMDLSKIRVSTNINVIWRMRLGHLSAIHKIV